MFPEITSAAKRFFGGFTSSEPISLGLKEVFTIEGIANNWYDRNGFSGIPRALGFGSQAWSGERISVDSALNHSVVWACNRIISETKGTVPCVMKQRSANGNTRDAVEHPLYSALLNSPNSEMTASTFAEVLTSHSLLRGNAFAKIIRRSSKNGTNETGLELDPIHPDRVEIGRDKQGRLIYVVRDDKTYTVERGKAQGILHIKGLGDDGLRGYSVIQVARQSIGTAIAAEHSVAEFYASGGRLPYNLKLNQKFANKDDAEKFRAEWKRIYSTPHTVPILEPWFDYQTTGLSLKDAQLLESRQFGIPEICRWFSLSPHMVQDLSRATHSNIEQLSLEFEKFTMRVHFNRWQQELWRCVLTPEEQMAGYFFRHDTNALLAGDFATRIAGYVSMLQNGPFCIDDVLDLEDRNHVPNGAGQAHYVQLNMQTIPGTGPALTPPAKPTTERPTP